MSEFEIRIARIEDFDSILPLLHQLWPDKELHKGVLTEVFCHSLSSGNKECFCAQLRGRIVGYCSLAFKSVLWQEGLMGYVEELVVDESVRRIGIGSALMKRAIDAAREKGCKRIELDSGFHRKEAHEFYERIGFEKRAYLFSKQL